MENEVAFYNFHCTECDGILEAEIVDTDQCVYVEPCPNCTNKIKEITNEKIYFSSK